MMKHSDKYFEIIVTGSEGSGLKKYTVNGNSTVENIVKQLNDDYESGWIIIGNIKEVDNPLTTSYIEDIGC